MIASKRAHLSIREADICDRETPQMEVGLFFFSHQRYVSCIPDFSYFPFFSNNMYFLKIHVP